MSGHDTEYVTELRLIHRIPVNSTTLRHFSVSSPTSLPNSAGVIGFGNGSIYALVLIKLSKPMTCFHTNRNFPTLPFAKCSSMGLRCRAAQAPEDSR